MSDIDLLIDEENELTFDLKVEGTTPGSAVCRLVIESENMSLAFNSEPYNGEEVSVIIPPLGKVLKEGNYDMNLEVIVEDRYFKPLTLVGNFEKRLRVSAASTPKRKKRQLVAEASLSNVRVKSESSKSPVKTKRQTARQVTDKDILTLIEALTGKSK